jgi:hypothetical protein
MVLAAMLVPNGEGQGHSAGPEVPASAWIVAVALVLVALPTPYALFDPNPKFWTAAEKMAIQWAKPIPTLAIYVCGLWWLLARGVALPQWLQRWFPSRVAQTIT